MNQTRRFLLQLLVGLSAAAIGLVRRVFMFAAPPAQAPAALVAMVDIFIPDGDGPGAVQLGVPNNVHAWTGTHPKLTRLLAKTITWLDREAEKLDAKDFSSLNEGDRNALLTRLAQGVEGREMQRYLLRLRAESMTHYYADRRGWAGLDYAGPPQPEGFMDYTQPPSRE